MQAILGLEIKEEKIKILELTNQDAVFVVNRIDKISLPFGCLKDGLILNTKLVAEKLSSYLKANNITTKEAVVLLDSPYAFTKIIRMPHNLSDEQIRLNLEAELVQYRLFAGKEFVLDFKKIEEISEEGVKKANVLFGATFRQLSGSYLAALEAAGLDLIGMDVPILSMIRLLEGSDLKAPSLEVSLVVLIADKRLDMCILKGSRPRFLHTVEIDNVDFQKNQEDFISGLISAIKLVVNFYQARFIQGEEITRILISPLDARYSQVSALLKEKFTQIPIQEPSFLSRFRSDDKSIQKDELSFSSVPLLGAALRVEGKAHVFDLNFLLEQKTKKQSRMNQMYLLFICLTFIFVLALISLFWLTIRMNISQAKIKQVNSQLTRPSSDLNSLLQIKQRENILTKQLQEASFIIGQSASEGYFKKIAKAMVLVPNELWLTDVLLGEEEELLLKGEAKVEKPIFKYVSGLSGSGYFDAVDLISSRSEEEAVVFTIRCKLH